MSIAFFAHCSLLFCLVQARPGRPGNWLVHAHRTVQHVLRCVKAHIPIQQKHQQQQQQAHCVDMYHMYAGAPATEIWGPYKTLQPPTSSPRVPAERTSRVDVKQEVDDTLEDRQQHQQQQLHISGFRARRLTEQHCRSRTGLETLQPATSQQVCDSSPKRPASLPLLAPLPAPASLAPFRSTASSRGQRKKN